MSENRYTLLLVPDKPGRVTRLHLTQRTLKLAFGSAVAGAVLFLTMSVLSANAYRQMSELRMLKRQNQAQKEQLLVFASRLEDLKHTIDRVSEFDAKLRVIADVDEGTPRIPGAGGPTPEDMAAFSGNSSNGEQMLMARIQRDLNDLTHQALAEELSLQQLSSHVQDKRSVLGATPMGWPTKGWLTSSFGGRIHPFSGTAINHEGLDIAAAIGTPVIAPANGVVLFSGTKGGYGKLIIIDHGYGHSTRYGHLSELHVKAGQRVRRGDRIASVGNTGRSTGPHLHYEVRVNNLPVNPRRYMLN